MDQDSFTLKLDGLEAAQGRVDVRELAPALIGFADLFDLANRSFNGGSSQVIMSAQAGFRKGSFEVQLVIDRHLIETASLIIPSLPSLGADQLLSLVLGEVKEKGKKVVTGLLRLLAETKGEKPKFVRHDESKNIAIYVMGSGNEINVDQATAFLYESETARRSLGQVSSSLVSGRVETLQVTRDGKQVADLSKAEVSGLVPPELEERIAHGLEASKADEIEMIVRLEKPSFGEGKWTFSDGSKTFNATMRDDAFRAQVKSRAIGFYSGDFFRVIRKTVQKIHNAKLTTVYEILRVLGPVSESGDRLLF